MPSPTTNLGRLRGVPVRVALFVCFGMVIVCLNWLKASDWSHTNGFFSSSKSLQSAYLSPHVRSEANGRDSGSAELAIDASQAVDTFDVERTTTDMDQTTPPTPAPTTLSKGSPRSRVEKMEERSKEMLAQVNAIRDHLDEAKEQVQSFSDRLIELEAMFVVDLPVEYKRQSAKPQLKCIGWRATGQCAPDGPRERHNDRDCDAIIEKGISGYCEVEDLETEDRFRVRKTWCDSQKDGHSFRCSDAIEFVNFGYEINKLLSENTPLPEAAPTNNTNGVVMVVYPRMLPGVFATVRTLRQFNCILPVELWYKQTEMDSTHPILQHLVENYGPISLRNIDRSDVQGYITKIYAIDNSDFTNVLFLDADNVPARDPTFLFSSPEFVLTGALFWPDYWDPSNTYFNIKPHSHLWEYLDLPFVDMYEQESGQLVINRAKSHRAMQLLNFLAYHTPNYLQDLNLVHGDKELFRLAWMKSSSPFLMIDTLPGLAGPVKNKIFCGATMVQHDMDGNILFFHRNAHKLQGRAIDFNAIIEAKRSGKELPPYSGETEITDPLIWTHIQDFKKDANRKDYHIDLYGDPVCYGKESPNDPNFDTIPIQKTPFANLEQSICNYAAEATDVLRTFIENAPADQDVSKYLW